ncbi:hypothetical protein [Rhodoglobus sp.]
MNAKTAPTPIAGASSPQTGSTRVAIQQLDPLGTLDGRPISVTAGIAVVLFTALMLWSSAGDPVDPWLAGLALIAVLVTAVVLILGTSPLRAPFTGAMHALGVGSSIIAFALISAALGGATALPTAYWAPLVVGTTCIALAPYRPVRELVAVGIVASIFTGFAALVWSSGSTNTSQMIVILFSITPVLTMSLGGAAFARSLALSHQRWESRAVYGARRLRERQHVSVARSVQQDRVTILNRFVVPLFAELSSRGIVSPDDRAKAAEYSASLRELMVTEVNRSWLESVVAQAFGSLDDGTLVQDPHRLANAMTAHQRTALRAAVLAVATGGELSRDSVRLSIEKTSTGAMIVVRATVTSSESSWRSSLAPYFAVLRVVFTGLQISYRSPSLTVRFTYDTP